MKDGPQRLPRPETGMNPLGAKREVGQVARWGRLRDLIQSGERPEGTWAASKGRPMDSQSEAMWCSELAAARGGWDDAELRGGSCTDGCGGTAGVDESEPYCAGRHADCCRAAEKWRRCIDVDEAAELGSCPSPDRGQFVGAATGALHGGLVSYGQDDSGVDRAPSVVPRGNQDGG